MRTFLSRESGYSFIELIVVIGILMIVVGGSIASYASFQDKEKVKQAALTLKSNLRLAQSKAVSGEKPVLPNATPSADCKKLMGYVLQFSGTFYSIQAQCTHSDGTQGNAGFETTIPVPSGVTVVPSAALIQFYPLDQGVSDELVVSISSHSHAYQITVTKSGKIDDNGYCADPSGDPLVCPTPTPTPTPVEGG